MSSRKPSRYRPSALDALEDRVVLSLATSGVVTASEVFRNQATRPHVGHSLREPFQAAYTQLQTDLQSGLDAVAAGGDVATFQASLDGLLATLNQSLQAALASSPRSAGSLSAAVKDSIVSNDATSLLTRLRAELLPPIAYTDLTATGQAVQDIVSASQRANLARLNSFIKNPGTDFTGNNFESRFGAIPATATATTTTTGATPATTASTTASATAARISAAKAGPSELLPVHTTDGGSGSTLTLAQRHVLRLGQSHTI